MKILHSADLHFTNKQNIHKDILKCSNFLLDVAENEKPDLIVIAGDIFEERVSLDSDATIAATDFILKAGGIAPVSILKGTPTHDVGNSLHIFGKLNTRYPVHVSEDVEQICLKGSSFVSLEDGMNQGCSAVISCLPSIQKGNLLALKDRGFAMQDGDYEIADLLKDVLQSFGVINQEAKQYGIPTILVGHGSVMGASLSTGQQMVGKDIEFDISDLRLARADLYCLGHIHKAQRWNEVFYAGSLTRLNYGEEEEKGFFIHEILESSVRQALHHNGTGQAHDKVRSRFIPTPARLIKTIRCDGLPADNILTDEIKGAFLKITYSVPEEDIHKVDEEQLKRNAIERGTREVKIEKTIIPKVRVRAEGISKIKSLDEKIIRWGETVGQDIPQGAFDKLALLETEEEKIIESYNIKTLEEENETALFKAQKL